MTRSGTFPSPRSGSSWERRPILGYTIGNDVSSREIEGANPLYLSQAKIYAGACAIGPSVFVPEDVPESFAIGMRILDEYGVVAYEGRTSTKEMVRSFSELVDWLLRDNPVPPGSVLLTGTGLVPPDVVHPPPGPLGGDPRPRDRHAREPRRARR